jgi:hypothetical protein
LKRRRRSQVLRFSSDALQCGGGETDAGGSKDDARRRRRRRRRSSGRVRSLRIR